MGFLRFLAALLGIAFILFGGCTMLLGGVMASDFGAEAMVPVLIGLAIAIAGFFIIRAAIRASRRSATAPSSLPPPPSPPPPS
jgi:hypothetical protein